MAASLKAPQMRKLEVGIHAEVYDQFMRNCSKKGYAANVLIEKLMKEYNEKNTAN